MAKKLEAEYMKELNSPLSSEEEEEEVVSSSIDCGGKKSKMVGLSDSYKSVKNGLLADWPTTTQTTSLVGMAGIGKTTLAKRVFEDSLISSHFECRAWLKVGRKRQLNQIARAILAQVDPNYGDRVLLMKEEEDEDIFDYLKKTLRGRRFLIALDDVWDSQLVSEDTMRKYLPFSQNGSRVLLTTRLQKVARSGFLTVVLEMPLLGNEESWDLLREKLFGEEPCPFKLEKVGKKIAEKCDGLPLMIITVADLLSKAEKTLTLEYWSKVATERQHSIFKDAFKEMSQVLYPSYDNLSQHLKICFLYMGVFYPNLEIPHLKLISMWIAEGFLEPNTNKTAEGFGVECLEELVSNTLVMVHQRSSIILLGERMPFSPVKTCRIHSALWDLCSREAARNKFFHVLSSRKDGLDARMKCQRRLCIHNNVLFGIKDVYNSIEDSCASTARSLLCTGPYHQFQVPICFGLGLLRVLDALTIRFYEFPIQVVKLVLLRYLALTCNGDISASISKLCHLQFLIVCPHLSIIKSCEAPVYFPVEIWDMKELEHLQIMGSHLPDPCGKQLQNLLTFLDASAGSCTKSVLEGIPNLKKLGVQIRLVDDHDSAKTLGCLQHISHLNKLETLKIVIVNPEWKAMDTAPAAAPLPHFPSNLRKLTLSGMGYPWEEISKIASLPCLKVLKLRQYAFRGPKWNVEDQCGFPKLDFLLIEDSDLVQWKVGNGGFPFVGRLCIKHCYQLEEFELEFCEFLAFIEVVDCNPAILTCLKLIEEAALRRYMVIKVDVHSSWDEEKRKR
ncbi:hypothetical protein C2S51_006778 [Perilla frutescens var. frutescens]|nr:hypothetical protein C2S51_006778 [Perilla frutescens var. frutescens]